MNKKPPYIIGKIPKLPARYAAVIIPFLLSCLMSGSISLINVFRHMGWTENFIQVWLSAWLFSWIVAFPLVLVLLPLVRRFTSLLVDMPALK